MAISINDKHKDFFDSVFQLVRMVPEGRVTSYGAIAKYIGSAKSSRMVGWAMNISHRLPGIPAHRVVNRKGLLTGKMHFATPNDMADRLKAEGIEVVNDQVVAFDEIFWDPMIELKMP